MKKWIVVRLVELNIDIVFKQTLTRNYPIDEYDVRIKFPRNVKKFHKDFHTMVWTFIYNKIKNDNLPCFIRYGTNNVKYLRDYNGDYRKISPKWDMQAYEFSAYAIALDNSILIHTRIDLLDKLIKDKVIRFYYKPKISKWTKFKSLFKREKFTIDILITPVDVIKIDKYGL